MDKKTWIAFALCMLIFLVWFNVVVPYFTPPPPKKPVGPQTPATAPATSAGAPSKEAAPAAQPAPKEQAAAPAAKEAPAQAAKPAEAKPHAPAAVASGAPEQKFTLDADDLPMTTEWTSVGGALNKLVLKDYYTDVSKKQNEVLFERLPDVCPTLSLIDPQREANPIALDQRMASPLAAKGYDVVEHTDRKIVFRSVFDKGLEVTKTFEVEAKPKEGPPKYDILVHIMLRNVGQKPLQEQYSLVAPAGIMPDRTTYITYLTSQIAIENGPRNPAVPADQQGMKIPNVVSAAELLKNGPYDRRDVVWAGVASNYFTVITRPVQEKTRFIYAAAAYPLPAARFPLEGALPAGATPTPNILTELTTNLFDLKPGQSITQEYIFYAGPKRASVLAAYGNMSSILDYDYGKFGPITILFLWMLAQLHKVIPNYGMGIIFLTFLVKVVLHPLTRKTQVSMFKMQKLQPKINALREKYKHDQKTMGSEQWKLFREHRVNPLGGCLPMLVQIPVLIALYNGIAYSIEFRQQPFLGWVHDLARPDAFMTLPFQIPLLHSTLLNVLPLVMVVTWVVQQMTMPKPVDPQQAQQQKMMMFMPIVFGFMFYSMPSGLVLYWLTNTVLGIVEQFYIKKHLATIVIE